MGFKVVTQAHGKTGEQELIHQLKQGNRQAFEDLVDQYQHRLLAIACGITLDREESLEIVQDVFISVHRNIHNFRGEAGLMTWMRKITVNMCLNWKRKWTRRFKWSHHSIETDQGHFITEVETGNETPESSYMNREFETLVMEKVSLLPEKFRSVFVLKTLENISYEEIGQTLGIKTGTVKSRLHHARKLLAESMQMKTKVQ